MFPVRSRAFSSSILIAVLAHAAAATTYTVDATGGAGSQFTDIQAAVAAAAPGDFVFVREGTYAPFTVAAGITIHGRSHSVFVNGPVVAAGIPAGERLVMILLNATELRVDACSGPVYVESVDTQNVTISNCLDVRFTAVGVLPPNGPPVTGIEVVNSRLELLTCQVRGSSSPAVPAMLHDGGAALHATDHSRIHAARTSFYGGQGGLTFTAGVLPGDGGSALILEGESSMRQSGGSVHGGSPGTCVAPECADCSSEGAPGFGIVVLQGATMEYAGSTLITAAGHLLPPLCTVAPPVLIAGSGASSFPIDDPEVFITSIEPPPTGSTGGTAFTYEIAGPAGSTAVLWVGRGLIVHPTPPIALEQLITHDRGFPLGVIPPSGTVTITLTVPYGMPKDFTYGVQAEVQYPTGEIRRSYPLQTNLAGL